MTRAEAVLEAYKRVKQQGQGPEAKHNSSTQQNWIPLPANVFKVNIDAIVNFGKQLARLGAVIRDYNSKVIVVVVKSTQFTRDVKIAKAEAAE